MSYYLQQQQVTEGQACVCALSTCLPSSTDQQHKLDPPLSLGGLLEGGYINRGVSQRRSCAHYHSYYYHYLLIENDDDCSRRQLRLRLFLFLLLL